MKIVTAGLVFPPALVIPEAAPIPAFRGSFSALTDAVQGFVHLRLFDELSRGGNIEAVVRSMLVESVAAGLDLALLSSTPPGLLGTPIAASVTTNLHEAMLADLSFRAALAAGFPGICLRSLRCIIR